MSIIHLIILLFLWTVSTIILVHNIESYYKMKNPIKKRNERLTVAIIILIILIFRWVIATYLIYLLIANTLWFVMNLFTKNKYFQKTFYLTFIIPIIIIIIGMINVSKIQTTTYHFTNNEIKNDIKMAFISDIHLSTLTNKKLDKLINILNEKNYDTVILGGDLIDEFSREKRIIEVINKLGTIKTKYGIYYIEGNHDLLTATRRNYFLTHNIMVLADDSVLIDNSYYLVGRRDIKDKKRKKLNNLISTIDKPIILLDHQPYIDKNLTSNIIIQLSGHTHAGQIWPLGYFLKYGYYKDKRLIVSSGLGAWHNPVRTSKYSEIIELNITKS